ncbi:1,4-dihydroxy-2-naphthoate prenyltransferase [Saccharibacillus sp. O23]|uniref:prenyltransferase n=1 Tax=Saccharibacillus sp. O23 TaxID=2009338 RepID=UPI000B4E519D|nr:prenyltransferase [Saccharibacillus sp. O23]OWR31896.1 1,4-dihydroxy-2-naphthoate prenyltransferase [Saccharibacillus sp. O23]
MRSSASSAAAVLRNGLILMRPAAVGASSFVIIFSGMYPLFLDPAVPAGRAWTAAVLLLAGCLLIHGLLTHALNDYTDYRSGTDERSPALLSGGSRIIQNGRMTPEALGRFGYGLTAALLACAVLLILLGQTRLAALLLIGIWGAVSYSAPPLRLAYIPLAGEWLSTFPSTFALGLGGVWLLTGSLPEWAVQNAWINAMYCIAWVMVHHIPDLEADRQASPVKRTSVVWAADRFGIAFARLPAAAYFAVIGLSSIWFAGSDRWIAAGGIVAAAALSIFWLAKADMRDAAGVTACEKKMLLTAILLAVWLGIFY